MRDSERERDSTTYLITVSDTNLKGTLTKYKLSEHNLTVEVSRHRQTWLSREERLCSYCDQETVETELHFLPHCNQYQSLRDQYFAKITHIFPEFLYLSDLERLTALLGEREDCCRLAARYVAVCHELHSSVNPLFHMANT